MTTPVFNSTAKLLIDAVGEEMILELQGRTALRVGVLLINGTWNGCVLGLQYKVGPNDPAWTEVDTTQRISSAPSVSASPINVAAYWAVRLYVITKSATSGSVAAVSMTATDAGPQLASAPAHALLGSIHSDVATHTPVLGDMIYGNSTPSWDFVSGSIATQRAILTQTGNGSVSAKPAWLADDPLLTNLDTRQRIFVSPTTIPQQQTAIVLASGTAYFLYLGRATVAMTPKYVRAYITSAGSGAQTAEVGLFSSANPPNGGAQSLTKLVATGTVDDLTTITTATLTLKGNTSAFATSIAAGTHLWAGIRTALASSQPGIPRLHGDYNSGSVLFAAGSGALTGAGPFTGAVSGDATATAPWLFVTLD